ncbi:hypothetical protein ACFWB2_33365 [Streptomyces virginiae]
MSCRSAALLLLLISSWSVEEAVAGRLDVLGGLEVFMDVRAVRAGE